MVQLIVTLLYYSSQGPEHTSISIDADSLYWLSHCLFNLMQQVSHISYCSYLKFVIIFCLLSFDSYDLIPILYIILLCALSWSISSIIFSIWFFLNKLQFFPCIFIMTDYCLITTKNSVSVIFTTYLIYIEGFYQSSALQYSSFYLHPEEALSVEGMSFLCNSTVSLHFLQD